MQSTHESRPHLIKLYHSLPSHLYHIILNTTPGRPHSRLSNTMTFDTTSPSPPQGAKRTTKIRRFVKRVASFASIRSNSRDAKGTLDPRTHVTEPVPEHPSPHFHHHHHPSGPEVAHDDAVGIEPPTPPSPLQAPTETPRSPQNMLLSPRRDDDANSMRSGSPYLSDSQESSFSGLSALPSDYNRSAATSPEQVRMTLRDTSLCVVSLHPPACCAHRPL